MIYQGGCFEWRGYGMKLYVPKDSFTTNVGECTLNIRVSLTGHFQLPEDSNFLSPVFWIAAPCRFTKPVTLEIQHCALREDETALSHLTFISTKCSQKNLPYIFRELDGGVFTIHNSYVWQHPAEPLLWDCNHWEEEHRTVLLCLFISHYKAGV